MRISPDPTTVQNVFAKVASDMSFNESRKLSQAGLPVAEMLQAMSMRPELLKAFAGFGQSVYPGGLLPRELKECVILKASLMNACQFCADSHISMMKQLNISEDPVAYLASIAQTSDRHKVTLEYTEIVTRDSNRVSDELFAKLKLHFSEPEIVELTFLIGFINMLNRFNNALGVRYENNYEGIVQ